jgi:hypothetical protein
MAGRGEDAVRGRPTADPWHADARLRIVGVDPWTVLPDGRVVRR